MASKIFGICKHLEWVRGASDKKNSPKHVKVRPQPQGSQTILKQGQSSKSREERHRATMRKCSCEQRSVERRREQKGREQSPRKEGSSKGRNGGMRLRYCLLEVGSLAGQQSGYREDFAAVAVVFWLAIS